MENGAMGLLDKDLQGEWDICSGDRERGVGVTELIGSY